MSEEERDKAVIEAFMSDEEFLTSMVKQGFSTDGIRRQEVTLSYSKHEVSPKPEVRERKLEDENFEATMFWKSKNQAREE